MNAETLVVIARLRNAVAAEKEEELQAKRRQIQCYKRYTEATVDWMSAQSIRMAAERNLEQALEKAGLAPCVYPEHRPDNLVVHDSKTTDHGPETPDL